ncbi:MAG: hypothetical protein CL878_02950 [Dehalococcoidia bacterium]|nr:hypothetical protein [Dehalococcoidia bacterium]
MPRQRNRPHDYRRHEDAAHYHAARTALKGTALYHSYINDRIVACLPRRRFRRSLDLMCGDGILLPALEPYVTESFGLDISSHMLRYSSQRSQPSLLICGDARQLPFLPKTFDLVVVRGGLHHLPHTEHVYEITRLLKKDGILSIFEPCDDNLIVRMVRRILYYVLPDFDPTEEHGIHTQLVLAMLKSAGCRVPRVERLGVVAFALLCNPDAIPGTWWLNYLPGISQWTKVAIKIDEAFEKLPVLRRLCFNVLIQADKP